MKAYPHKKLDHGWLCEETGKKTKMLSTDRGRKGCFNSCEHCGDDKRSLGQRLRDLNNERANA